MCDCFARGDKPKLHRARPFFRNWILRSVEEIPQRHVTRLCYDDAKTPIVPERSDAVLVHKEAPVRNEPRRHSADLRQKKRIANSKRRKV